MTDVDRILRMVVENMIVEDADHILRMIAKDADLILRTIAKDVAHILRTIAKDVDHILRATATGLREGILVIAATHALLSITTENGPLEGGLIVATILALHVRDIVVRTLEREILGTHLHVHVLLLVMGHRIVAALEDDGRGHSLPLFWRPRSLTGRIHTLQLLLYKGPIDQAHPCHTEKGIVQGPGRVCTPLAVLGPNPRSSLHIVVGPEVLDPLSLCNRRAVDAVPSLSRVMMVTNLARQH